MADPGHTQIGTVTLTRPFGLAPMAGMTDTAFRRLVKRQGGCGLVVTEMVSSEGLVRGIDSQIKRVTNFPSQHFIHRQIAIMQDGHKRNGRLLNFIGKMRLPGGVGSLFFLTEKHF